MQAGSPQNSYHAVLHLCPQVCGEGWSIDLKGITGVGEDVTMGARRPDWTHSLPRSGKPAYPLPEKRLGWSTHRGTSRLPQAWRAWSLSLFYAQLEGIVLVIHGCQPRPQMESSIFCSGLFTCPWMYMDRLPAAIPAGCWVRPVEDGKGIVTLDDVRREPVTICLLDIFPLLDKLRQALS